jgi:hypothetical protein
MNPDKMTLEAMGRVYRTEPAFVAYLEVQLDDFRKHVSRVADAETLRWTQGRMQQLEDLLADLKRASML